VLKRIAADDWRRFLHARAEEMAPGARMVLTMAGHSYATASTGASYAGCESFMELMNQTLLDLVNEGRINTDFYERFALPVYARDIAETVAPIQDPQSGLRSKLVVEYAETRTISCKRFEALLKVHDRAAYAHETVESIRAFTQPFIEQGLFCHALQQNPRIAARDRTTVEALFNRMKVRVAANPDAYLAQPTSIFLVITRV
jgi:hypothetical protein